MRRIDIWTIYVDNDEISTSWPGIWQNLIACQNNNFEVVKTLFDISFEADFGKFIHNSEFICDDI